MKEHKKRMDAEARRAYNKRKIRKDEMDLMFDAIKGSLPKAESGSRSKWVSHFKGLRPSKVKNFDRIGKGIKGMTPRPERTPRKDRAIGKGPEQVEKPRYKGR